MRGGVVGQRVNVLWRISSHLHISEAPKVCYVEPHESSDIVFSRRLDA